MPSEVFSVMAAPRPAAATVAVVAKKKAARKTGQPFFLL
jgi:hypothetical protein